MFHREALLMNKEGQNWEPNDMLAVFPERGQRKLYMQN